MDSTTQARTSIRWLPLAIGTVAFVALGALLAFGLAQARGNTSTLNLQPAPDFTVPLYSGGTGQFTLSDHLGQPVVLNFWGSWCPPCRAEFPALQAIADQYSDGEVVVFGVDVQDTEADAREFLEEQNTSFPTGPDLTGEITLSYTITNMPTTFFITRDGEILKKWQGMIDEANLTTFIEELLEL